MNEVLSGLRDVRSLAELGEPLDVEALRGLLARVPEAAPDMSREELEAVKAEVDKLFSLAEEQRDNLAVRLDELHDGRTAIQGYNHLKTLHTAQRLSKRA